MRIQRSDGRQGERGSAMVIAVLVIVILTLLGISFLLMAETENRIAENERLGQQALYFGESGVRQIKRWFDYPASGNNLINPPLNVIDRTLRHIDDDGDPTTAPLAANGVANGPLCYFKQGWDVDADGTDDVFEKPYREGPKFALMGTEDHPDMRIHEDASGAAKTFLGNLSTKLLADFPTQNYRARIRSIDIFEPPYVQNGAQWVRYGIGTVKVIARVYRTLGDGTEQVLAERMIKAVLNETPYYGPMGPLHSCTNMTWSGDFAVHWGLSSSAGNIVTNVLPNSNKKIPGSLAREEAGNPRLDFLWGRTDYLGGGTKFEDYVTAMTGRPVEDPWSRILSVAPITGPGVPIVPLSNPRTTFPWVPATALGDEEYEAGVEQGALAGAMHVMPDSPVSCIDFPYDVWKAVATSGEGDVHYYTWSSGTSFKENGFGTAQTFETLTDDKTGLYFFDTKDGVEPTSGTGEPPFSNLTPAIKISGGTWGTRGFVYLNTTEFQTKGVTGRDADFQAPGEPYLDLDADTNYDAGEPFVDLTYPTSLTDNFTVEGMGATYDGRGPVVTDDAVVWGILYNSGEFNMTGNARYYGSILTRTGMGGTDAGTPEVWWDESIKTNWPPAGWELPRVVITKWETDL